VHPVDRRPNVLTNVRLRRWCRRPMVGFLRVGARIFRVALDNQWLAVIAPPFCCTANVDVYDEGGWESAASDSCSPSSGSTASARHRSGRSGYSRRACSHSAKRAECGGIPANPAKTPLTGIPANPAKTPLTGIPANPAKTPLTGIPANPTKTPLTGIPANPAKTHLPTFLGSVVPNLTHIRPDPTQALSSRGFSFPLRHVPTRVWSHLLDRTSATASTHSRSARSHSGPPIPA